jgi:hypothetical protein
MKLAAVDYQRRAVEFHVGDIVFPYGESDDASGRVLAVYPGIGMVDVEFPTGTVRCPVEDLQRNSINDVQGPSTENLPAGDGLPPDGKRASENIGICQRVARRYAKKALYWAEKDRKYRATKSECDSGQINCPKCKEAILRKAIYKREDGMSDHLLGCPSCLFLVHREAILNDL